MAESPDQLERFIAEELERKQNELNEARKIIPELKSIHNVLNRPKIRFYEGKEGLEQVYEDTLSSHGEILAYASVEDIQPTLPHYFPPTFPPPMNLRDVKLSSLWVIRVALAIPRAPTQPRPRPGG